MGCLIRDTRPKIGPDAEKSKTKKSTQLLPSAVPAPVAVLRRALRFGAVGAGDVVSLVLAGSLADLHFELHAFAFAQTSEPTAQDACLVHEHVVEFCRQRFDEAETLEPNQGNNKGGKRENGGEGQK